ncbi:RNA polymerase sigma factor sigV, partial [Dysosmobacter welbionis]
GHLGCDFRSPAAVFLKAGGGGSVGRIGDGANGEEWDAVCMADMGNGRGFHIRAKGVKCGPHGLCPRAREKGFSGHHPPEADGAAGVLGRLGGQGEQEGVPREPDGVHPGMELRENILSYIVIGGLCADDGIKDGDGWVDASCCARIDDGFHSAAVNEDLGSDGRIDLADTTV